MNWRREDERTTGTALPAVMWTGNTCSDSKFVCFPSRWPVKRLTRLRLNLLSHGRYRKSALEFCEDDVLVVVCRAFELLFVCGREPRTRLVFVRISNFMKFLEPAAIHAATLRVHILHHQPLYLTSTRLRMYVHWAPIADLFWQTTM